MTKGLVFIHLAVAQMWVLVKCIHIHFNLMSFTSLSSIYLLYIIVLLWVK